MNSARWVSRAGRLPVVSRMLRWWANQFAENSVVTIRHGGAAGLRWRRHHRYVNGYWLGHYELAIQEALKRLLGPGMTFYDVGANAGFFSLVAARWVGPQGRCIAFEPLPENHESILDQIMLNHLSNCQAVPLAVGDRETLTTICYDQLGSSTAHLGVPVGCERQIAAHVVTLDAACAEFGVPDVLKLDIEGAEVAALRGASRLLREVKPAWLIELHGPRCEAGVKELLTSAGYRFCHLDGRPLACETKWPSHVVAHGCRTGSAGEARMGPCETIGELANSK